MITSVYELISKVFYLTMVHIQYYNKSLLFNSIIVNKN